MSKAVSVRAHGDTMARTSGQSDHDLREGLNLDEHGELVRREGDDPVEAERKRALIPAYVDKTRCHLNSVIIPTKRGPELRRLCEQRRSQRATQRALKSNAAVSTSVIITFGKKIQPKIDALPFEIQNRAYLELMQKIATEANNTVSGLVAHRDETAPHAHGQMPAVNLDGIPNSKIMNREFHRRMQDWAAEIWQRYVPEVERGVPKSERIVRGEEASKIYNRTVRELHYDLPVERDALASEIIKLRHSHSELLSAVENQRVLLEKSYSDLEKAKNEGRQHSERFIKILKRSQAYERRLITSQSELEKITSNISNREMELEKLNENLANADIQLAQIKSDTNTAEKQLLIAKAEFGELKQQIVSVSNKLTKKREHSQRLFKAYDKVIAQKKRI